ncbi:MAG: hypothetical protein HC809_10070 [Gammaproteobacteria bacterium]|nr:hypothetical protein [Gammaproteobacteria bacterium]
MPHTLLWTEHGLIRSFRGEVPAHELVVAVGETLANARFDALCYIINDFTDTESVDLDRQH